MARRSTTALILLAEGFRRLGEDVDPVLRRFGLDPAHLDPNALIDQALELRINVAIAERLRDPLAGLGAGSTLGLGTYGPFTLLLLTCADPAASMRTAIRFQQLSFLFGRLGFEPGPARSALTLVPAALPPPAHRFRIDLEVAGTWKLELIRTVRGAQARFGGGDRRTVLIHGQYLRADQIPQLRELGIVPALFPMHTFYWGDWHRDSVAGPQRAAFISPTAAVLAAGLRFTIHSDAPVTFPNSMRVLDSAVNRVTRSGQVLGPDQRISPEVALRAMTLWAAWQHFEDDSKGSLEPGKRADLVVLSANPLTVDPRSLREIRVLETIKDGRSVYRASGP